MLSLEVTKRTDPRLLASMPNHYSKPKGFVGRNICYAILYNDTYYGHIVSGSACKNLPNRNTYFSIDNKQLNNIINNTYFHIEKIDGMYPIRNFFQLILKTWRKQTAIDWYNKYGNVVLGFETLIELPRTGDGYIRDGWIKIGQTKGYTCKRTAGIGTDSWSGRRVWDTTNLRPKLVFAYKDQ